MAMESDSVDLDPLNGTASLKLSSKPEFAQVVFRGIEDSYVVGTDVECRYSLTDDFEVSSRDWVGLYRVGWRNQSDYIYYEWSPVPVRSQREVGIKDAELNSCILFRASRMPKDDGEFYQFCYVTSSGQVRGASTPFQFKQAHLTDELIEIEDENGELLIIRTKTAVLEDQLKKANETRVMLKQEIQILENERDIMRRHEIELQKKLLRQKEIAESTDAKIKEMLEMITDGNHQRDHLQDCISSLQEKIEVINQEKLSMEKRLDDSDRYITSLQEKIKTLVNDKDALAGRTKSLEEEKELYKMQVVSSENSLQSYIQDNERVKMALIEEQLSGSRIRKELGRLECELVDQKNKLDAQNKTLRAEKVNSEWLSERLRNAEDKLSAAEHCKMMLNEEVLTLKQTFEKTSRDLELSKVDADKMRMMELMTSVKQSAEIDALRNNVKELENKLREKSEEAGCLSAEVSRLRHELDSCRAREKSEVDGPLYALQTAQKTLKERYEKLMKKNEELNRSREDAFARMRELNETDSDQKKEICNLRDRLLMGQDAYKEKFIECNRLETELYKISLQRNSKSPLLDIATASVSSCNVEKEVDASHTCAADVCLARTADQQLTELTVELERRHAKTHRYKRLLAEQKEKTRAACEELAFKDYELTQLKDFIKSLTCGPPGDQPLSKDVPTNIDQKIEAGMMAKIAASRSISGSEKSLDLLTRSDDQSTAKLIVPLKPLPPLHHPERLLPPLVLPERLQLTHRASLTDYRDDVGLNGVSRMIDSMDRIVAPPPTMDRILAPTPTGPTAVKSLASSAAAVISYSDPATAAATAAYEAAASASNTVYDEDRFEDAPGEPLEPYDQVLCPPVYPPDTGALNSFDIHEVYDHCEMTGSVYQPICPICDVMFDVEEADGVFQRHVNEHFRDEY